MMARKKVLQLGLTFVGVLLIFITYVLYPKSLEKKSTTAFNEENVITTNEEEDNTFKPEFIRSLPKDIINWMAAPDKREYYKLMKKYHPDKNNNTTLKFAKFITSHWNEMSIL